MGIKTFREGFTLVELSLSMVFIGILSVAIVLIISNTISSYQRGLTLNQINTNGMAIVDDMRTAIQNSNARSLLNECYRFYDNNTEGRDNCVKDGGRGFVSYVRTGSIKLYDKDAEIAPIYGVFCTGNYSYIWNSGYFGADYATIDDASDLEAKRNNWAKLEYTYSTGTNSKRTVRIVGSLDGAYDSSGQLIVNSDGTAGNPNKPFRLLKILDSERAICSSLVRNRNTASQTYNANIANSDIGPVFVVDNNDSNGVSPTYSVFPSDAVPIDLLLEDSDNDLALYDLYVATPAESATQKNSFYSVSFILGTMRGGADIFAQGKNCQVPADYKTEDFNYCAINKFSFGAATGGE